MRPAGSPDSDALRSRRSGRLVIRYAIQASTPGPRTGPVSSSSVHPSAATGIWPGGISGDAGPLVAAATPWTLRAVSGTGPKSTVPRTSAAASAKPSGSRRAPAHSRQAQKTNTPVTRTTLSTMPSELAEKSPSGRPLMSSVPYRVSTAWRLRKQPTASATRATSQAREVTASSGTTAKTGIRYRSWTRVGNTKKQRHRKTVATRMVRRSSRSNALTRPYRNPATSSTPPITTPVSGPSSGTVSDDHW